MAKIVLYLSPITPFLDAFKTYLNYGVLNVLNIFILILEIVVYYFIAYCILKKKTGQAIFKKKVE